MNASATSASHPYAGLPPNAFWRSAVATIPPQQISGVWKPKWSVDPGTPIATAGSCFAQHISKALVARGYSWFNAENPPKRMTPETRKAYNYDIFTFRTGNIYTARLLRQWVSWAVGESTPPNEIWPANGRYIDPFRPTHEPNGFASPEELLASRQVTLNAIRRTIETAHTFVFTLGLTEAWVNRPAGYVYPMCPGVAGGVFDANVNAFKNFTFTEIYDDLQETLAILRRARSGMRLLLTVSPVPLVATASADHVLVATIHSKSILRAVAGQLASERANVDYFPSFELISSFPFKGAFYEANLRDVKPEGVNFVMASFFSPFGEPAVGAARTERAPEPAATLDEPASDPAEDVVCEESLLSIFAPKEGEAR
ncbi:MAG: GSCFA domain-containing protein [Hyphomicrobiaceae bacterium]